MRTPWFAQLALVCVLSATLTAAEPLPDKAALDPAQRLVRDTYRDELTNEAGLKKILEEADSLTSTTDQAAAYLVVAQQSATSGWLRTGFAAIDRLARRFDYDAPAAKVAMLEGAVKRAKSVEDRVSIVNRCLELLDGAVADERFDVGEDAMKIASGVVSKIRDADLRKELAEKRKSFEKLKKENDAEWKKLSEAEATLKRNQNDGAANETLGRRYATLDDWGRAIPRLSKADDEDLRTAANNDGLAQKDATKQVLAADSWWNAAENAEGKQQRAYRARAVYWYTLALPNVSGLLKARAEKRIEEAGNVELAGQAVGDDSKRMVLLAPGVPLVLMKIPASADGKVKSFWLGQTEVTEAQWAAVMGDDTKPSRLPKGDVAVADVKSFLGKLNAPTTRFRFRLPQPEEAELAIGSMSQYGPDTAWYLDNSGDRVHDVATRRPNALGLYDIVGNVWEWCEGGQIYGAYFRDTRAGLGLRTHRPADGENRRVRDVGFRVAADLR